MMRSLITIVLLLFSLKLFSQTRVAYTQWRQEADYDIVQVDKLNQADVVLCMNCTTGQRVRLERHKMNADILLRLVHHRWNGVIKVYMTRNPSTPLTVKQKRNFEKYFLKRN